MLPQFPEFKKLELSDRDDIDKIAKKYAPYSDFNFACLWSWDVSDKFRISKLNGNLVVILTDHFSDKLFYSFLGNNEINLTLKQLFAFPIQSENSFTELRLVPEDSLKDIDLSKYLIEIDIDNCDYIYDLAKLAAYTGSNYSTKRYMANSFVKNHNPEIRLLDVTDQEKLLAINKMNNTWAEKKAQQDEGLNLDKEVLANQRFLEAGFEDMLAVGVYLKNELIGYSIFTCLPNKYAICHFSKADINYPGVYEYLLRESSKILVSKGCVCLNYEEDLGLPGLRFSKTSFKPLSFLRKYTITEL